MVIPNGTSGLMREALSGLQELPSVRLYPLDTANVSAARNYGLALSCGKLVRFLDDDDFLIPESAVRQCYELADSGAHVSTYGVRIEDQDRKCYGTLHPPDTEDFAEGQLGPTRLPLPHAHVFLASALRGLRWNVRFKVAEDIAWLQSIAGSREIHWTKDSEVVGVWYQHNGSRLTYPHAAQEPQRNTAESILDTTLALRAQGRLSEARKRAAAAGLWACVHRAFYLRPFYWHEVARKALLLDPSSHPKLPMLEMQWAKRLDPLWLEWLMLPKRSLNHLVRQVRGRLFGWDYVRTL